MTFYLLLLLSTTTLAFFSQYAGRKLCINLCVMTTVIIGAAASLRGLVGTDTYSYHLKFRLINTIELFDKSTLKIEPAFVAIAKLVDLFGGDSFIYISVIGILQTLLVILILIRLDRPALFLIYYIATLYINFQFNVLRQGTSMLFLMLSLTWIKEGGWKFYIPLLGSLLFHYSSILFVPYLLIYKQFKEGKSASLVWLIPIIVVGVLGTISYLGEAISDKSEAYSKENLEVSRTVGIGFLLQISLYIGLGVTIFKQSKLDVILFVLPVILIKIFIIRYPIVGRFDMFFNLALVCILTKDAIKGKQRELSGAILLIFSVLNVYGTLNGLTIVAQEADLEHRLSPYIPYHTLFDESR